MGSWSSCAGRRTCVSPGWDGSDSNTCAYDAAGNCCYSEVTVDEASTTTTTTVPSLPTCSHAKFSWSSCAGRRTCVSPGWDGCAASSCIQKIHQGTAVNQCNTTAGGIGCNYGSD